MLRHHVATVALLMSGALLISGQSDIVTPGAKGAVVVETVCNVLEASCIFEDDKLFTRRLAYVESEDGENKETFRPGYYGGIWQVSFYIPSYMEPVINEL